MPGFSVLFVIAASAAASLPVGIQRQLPVGYELTASIAASPDSSHHFYFVALAVPGDAASLGLAPARERPLLIYRQRPNGNYTLEGRNDDVILRVDEGGFNACDPFEARRIAVKGRYVTVENGVACGDHWTDYVTFRFDAAAQVYVFDNQRFQSWSANPSNRPGAQALIPNPVQLTRAPAGRAIPFSRWRRPD